jgi:diaminohydroxyphosphoribosylaminopyrimidine deaminase / 5-amino-6-(5-phosphoribosylamino)uracil reductase
LIIDPYILSKLEILSLQATGLSSPNPPVAALITDLEGKVLSEGHTQIVGSNHAEREAYAKLKNIPEHMLYVTLEPCSHTGRTPPCLELILTHKPKKVILGIADPNPLVRKIDSVEAMKNYGIEVVFSPEVEKIANSFLKGFLQRMKRKRPRFILKSALSQEGFFCTRKKSPIRLTNVWTDTLMQALRSTIDAIIVGPATVFKDSPGLSYRGYNPQQMNGLVYPNDPFWSSIARSVFGNTSVPSPDATRQPFRIFCLSSKYPIAEEFLQKQKSINTETKTKKTVFVSLDSLSYKEKEKLKILENYTLLESKPETLVDDLNEFLYNKGVNTLLVEGGNLLYNTYSKQITELDSILIIETPRSIANGFKPSISFESKQKEIEVFQLLEDKIIIYL